MSMAVPGTGAKEQTGAYEKAKGQMNWLDELEALAKAITPGPYVMSKGPFLAEVRSAHPANGRNYAHYQITADAEYDAALRNAAPRLIAITRAAEAILRSLEQGAIDDYDLADLRKALEAE